MLGVVLFAGYLLLFTWWVYRHPFFSGLGLASRLWIPALFCTKVAAGAAFAWFFSHQHQYEERVDTWRFFYQSLPEKDWLLADPRGFFVDLVAPRYAQDSGWLGTKNSLINDFKEVLMIKLSAIFNLFSGSRYYVNLIFFNYFVMFGQVALAVVWARFFKMSNARYMIAGIVLWPSVLFWSSTFHRDGLMLHAMGWMVWLLHQLYVQRRKWLLRLSVLLAYLLLLGLLRSYLALLLVLAIGAGGMVCLLPPRKLRWVLPLLAVLAVSALYGWEQLRPGYGLPQLLATRQQEFLALEGQSKLAPLPLAEGWVAMAQSVPEALSRAFIKPLPASGLQLQQWPPALENALWLLSLLPACWMGRQLLSSNLRRGWLMLVMVLVLGTALLTGLTIPFLGAITRYKSLWWPFMLPPVLYVWSRFIPPQSLIGRFFCISR